MRTPDALDRPARVAAPADLATGQKEAVHVSPAFVV
jgi:hypothetical protein